ncbi:hypothetical protein [Mangrovimonas sp. DI 80]|uniref:hypothetical protein n=1 Tax=Mangrovimonas sp. DI 80 TaxID=1779330 RepID=UPI0009759C1A|nr:hypothetical protein [Mangrovimonas sp. DI 80]OMP31785.1 hypothetical protein BKM32_01615 [Mangrovimonas sp. DI 80]
MKIAYIGGSWSSNIGNAFYNLGTGALFKQIAGIEAYFVPDPPQWKADTKNDFDFIAHLDVDLVLLTGPCLNLRLDKIFGATFKALKARRVKIGFLSAGMSLYDEGEAKHVAAFLNEIQPSFIFTRDTQVINFLKPKMKDAIFYDGLCASMFLNDAVTLPSLINKAHYYVYNFDKSNEPQLYYNNGDITITTPKKSIFKSSTPLDETFNGLPIIRTNNNEIDLGYEELYKRKDTYHSDLPYGYLSLLKDAKTVFSERVHTCAATLILGGTAQYIPKSTRSFEKRSNIFERIGLSDIFNKPVSLDFNYLNKEKENMVKALKEVLAEL